MKKKVEVKIAFPIDPSGKGGLEHIFKAERMLHKAGVSFDTGYDGHHREWFFDWSLKGAEVIIKKPTICESCRQIKKLIE